MGLIWLIYKHIVISRNKSIEECSTYKALSAVSKMPTLDIQWLAYKWKLWDSFVISKMNPSNTFTESKIHCANMGPIWGRQDPGGPHGWPHELCYLGLSTLCCIDIYHVILGYVIMRSNHVNNGQQVLEITYEGQHGKAGILKPQSQINCHLWKLAHSDKDFTEICFLVFT